MTVRRKKKPLGGVAQVVSNIAANIAAMLSSVPTPATPPVQRKRTYKRRDMKAEK